MYRSFSWLFVGLVSLSLASGGYARAEDGDTKVVASKKKETKKKVKDKVAKDDGEEIELFQAIEEKKVVVDFIPKDATEANVIFRNKTDKPLRLKLPATFAAVPVLGQGFGGGMGGMGGGGMGGGGMGGGGMGGGGMGGGGGNQGMGGGMGGGGMGGGGMGGGGMGGMGGGGMGGMGGGGGMFRVDADKDRKLKVPTVCLEHGKNDPNPRIKYKLIKLEEFNQDPKVAEVCRALGNGELAQNTAQAAAWHFASGLTWAELAEKPRVISEYTGVELWFTRFELQTAMNSAMLIEKFVEENEKTRGTSGTSGSTGG